MKSLPVAFLFAASAVASAQAKEQGELIPVTRGIQWAVGNQYAGPSYAWEGGDLRAPTVEEGSKRKPGPARYEDVRFSSVPVEPVLLEWLRSALAGEHPSRDINLVETIGDPIGGATVSRAMVFTASKITEVVIPAFGPDASQELRPALTNLSIKFAPGSVQVLVQAPEIVGAPKVRDDRLLSPDSFALAIDGLACTDVQSVRSITARIRPGSAPQISNIVLILRESSSSTRADWKTWFDSFVAQGNSTDAHEKNGTLDLKGIAPLGAMNYDYVSIGLKGLGIVRMSRLPRDVANYIWYEIELYCEAMTIKTPGVLTKPPPPEPGVTPLPLTEKPAEKTPATAGLPDDKGARDPEGAPRFAGSVRTAFTATRTKISNDEIADYTTRAEPAKVEAWFTEQMKNLEWQVVSRKEFGEDLAYYIDLRWERERKTAQVVVGKAKDGSTTIKVRLITTFE